MASAEKAPRYQTDLRLVTDQNPRLRIVKSPKPRLTSAERVQLAKEEEIRNRIGEEPSITGLLWDATYRDYLGNAEVDRIMSENSFSR